MRRSLSILLGVFLLLGLALPARGQEEVTSVGLEDALVLFHLNSPSLAVARSRLRREVADARQSRALPNPTASFSNEDLGDYSERYLNLRQPVDFLWGAGALGRRADAQALRARARFRGDSAHMALEATRAYLDAWRAAERVVALRRVDGMVEILVAAASARYEEGDLAGYDVRRLAVERASVARNLAQGMMTLALAEERLGSLVGDDATGRLRARALQGHPPVLADIDAQSLALRRPEVVEARSVVGSWEAEADMARSGIIQGASLIGGLKSQSDGQDGFFLGIELPLPLLDRRSEAVEAARAGVQGAGSDVEWVRRTVTREASLARAHLASVHELRSRLGDGGVDESEELLRIARVAYDEGEVGIVELIDAADAYLEARLMRIEIQIEGWLAYFELEQAVGGFADTVNIERGDER